MFIVKYKNYFLLFSLALVVASIVVISVFGLKFGIDFTGGSLVEASFGEGERPSIEFLAVTFEKENFGNVLIQPTDDNGYIIRMRNLEEGEHERVAGILSGNGKLAITEKRFDSIGPVVGTELRRKSYSAIALVMLLIVIYITFAFRKVSKPVNSWKYGLIAIITLAHDVIVPTGFFVLYGKFTGAEIDILFVTALLAILGFSIHDTIVVFDRIRENLRKTNSGNSFADTVGKSLSQTFTRSVNTSLTVAFTLLALILLGGDSVHSFAIVLLVGIIAGTYSSVFLASPLLVVFGGFKRESKSLT